MSLMIYYGHAFAIHNAGIGDATLSVNSESTVVSIKISGFCTSRKGQGSDKGRDHNA